MNALVRSAFGLIVLSASFAYGTNSKVRVEASPELRIGIVDANRDAATRDASHEAFAAGFAAAINKDSSAPAVIVKTKSIGADNAAFNLRAGVYDAVLVLGPSLPRPLMLSETSRLTATLSAGKQEKKVFLIFNNVDEGLTKVLTAAFGPAMANEDFRRALDGDVEAIASANGTKIAAQP